MKEKVQSEECIVLESLEKLTFSLKVRQNAILLLQVTRSTLLCNLELDGDFSLGLLLDSFKNRAKGTVSHFLA